MKLVATILTTMLAPTVLAFASDRSFQYKLSVAPHLSIADTQVIIDGQLDDAIWQHAQTIEDFHQVKPNEYKEPSMPTKVLVFYSEDSLYIGAQLFDEPSKVLASQFIQGKGTETDDQFHVTIDAFNSQRTGAFFQLNPNGIRREALIENDAFHSDWQTIWQGDAQINEQGWSVEMRIPYHSLSFDPQSEQWGINFGRLIRRHQEVIAWSSRGIDSWEMAPAASGKINSPQVKTSGKGIEIKTSFTAKDLNHKQSDTSEFKLEPSLDLFYKPSPDLTLAATLNTDFSATEVDERVINLTQFSVFLPEKRSFFLQDVDIFEFGGLTGNGRPFFSRKIGLDSQGKPLDIDAGVKLTGRINGFNYGLLNVWQDSEVAGEKENIFVGRLTANIFDESTLGVITTRGNPYDQSSASLWGADFNFRNSDAFDGKTIQSNLWYQESSSNGEASDNSAYGLTLAYPNDDLYVSLRHKSIGANFDPKIGFVNRNAIRRTDLSYGHMVRLNNSAIRHWSPWIDAYYVTDLSGRLLNKEARFYPATLRFTNDYYIAPRLVTDSQVIEHNFNIFGDVVISPGRYDTTRYGLRFITPSHKPLSFDFNYEAGDFFSGTSDMLHIKLNWRPWVRLLLSTEWQQTDASLQEGDFIARLYRFNSELAITSDWSWITTAQFDNSSKRLGINSLVRYQPSAAQSFTIVVNHNMQDTINGFQSLDTHYVAKLNYSFRF